MVAEESIAEKYRILESSLDERARRLWAGTEAMMLGRGGVASVIRATGLSRNTIVRGIREAKAGGGDDIARVRLPGGGRKRQTVNDPELPGLLEALVEPMSRGDPESPLRWTCKSTRRLSDELFESGHEASHSLVAGLLSDLGYSLQANRKVKEGTSHPDRNAQFEYINKKVSVWMARREPAISVDTKKKELVGDFKNAGREWHPKGEPERVRVHDFQDKELGKAIPYGVYDLARNAGWVSVGVDHDTAAFAVNTIERWWKQIGRGQYRNARSLLILADSGGSNGSRLRQWKWELQRLANDARLVIHVSHLPPGTSKWNKIEHRLFSFISQNWRGRPLITRAVIVSLIANTTTSTGLKVHCMLDETEYPTEVKISDQQMASIALIPDKFHGDWNYVIRPNR